MKKKFLLFFVLFLVLSSTLFGFSGKALAWNFDKSQMEVVGRLTNSEQDKFDVFQNAIEHEGLHPKDAAQKAGDTDYKNLQGNQYQIRLSQKARATFWVLNSQQLVKMIQLGGHT